MNVSGLFSFICVFTIGSSIRFGRNASDTRQPPDAMNMICTILAIILFSASSGRVLGEYCDNGTGECREFTSTDCPVIFYNQHLIGPNNVKYCDEFNDIVCCPLPLNVQQRQQTMPDTRRLFEKGKKIVSNKPDLRSN